MEFITVFKEATPLLLRGLGTTIGVSLISIAIGMFLGLVTCFMGRSKNPVFKWISAVYVWCVRGTPMIVQALVVFFGIPFITGIKAESFYAGIITLSLNAGAYMSEIFRGGIQAVSIGQIEAARSLGLSSFKTMLKIVLPQAFKMSIPAFVNQFIITIKDSSILSIIGLAELVNMGQVYIGATYIYFPVYTTIALYYLAVISVLMIISKIIEKKFSYDKKS